MHDWHDILNIMTSLNFTHQRVTVSLRETESLIFSTFLLMVCVACSLISIIISKRSVNPEKALTLCHLAYIDLSHGFVAFIISIYPQIVGSVAVGDPQCIPLDGSFLRFVMSLWGISGAISLLRHCSGRYNRTTNNHVPSSKRVLLSATGLVIIFLTFLLLYATPFTIVPLPRKPFASQWNHVRFMACVPVWNSITPTCWVYVFGISAVPTLSNIMSHVTCKQVKPNKHNSSCTMEYDNYFDWSIAWNSFALSSFPWTFNIVLLAKKQGLQYWVTLVLATLVSFHSFWNLLTYAAFNGEEDMDEDHKPAAWTYTDLLRQSTGTVDIDLKKAGKEQEVVRHSRL